jgi:type 1 fimbria pilin
MVVRTLCAFMVFFVTTAWAMGEQQGRVKMTGTLVATACSISSESLEQVIDLGSMPISELAKMVKAQKKSLLLN